MKYSIELEKLKNYALEIGAHKAAIFPAKELAVRYSAWAKCYIPGCKFYGSSIMCPPHNPLTPDVTSKIVAEYDHSILFQLQARVEDFVGHNWTETHVPTELKHKKMVAELEGRAFYMGFHLAMGFAAGECSLCLPQKNCAVLEGKSCLHPLRARPAMEACGFDVFSITKKAGWEIVPIGHSSTVQEVPCASLVGLVLVI